MTNTSRPCIHAVQKKIQPGKFCTEITVNTVGLDLKRSEFRLTWLINLGGVDKNIVSGCQLTKMQHTVYYSFFNLLLSASSSPTSSSSNLVIWMKTPFLRPRQCQVSGSAYERPNRKVLTRSRKTESDGAGENSFYRFYERPEMPVSRLHSKISVLTVAAA